MKKKICEFLVKSEFPLKKELGGGRKGFLVGTLSNFLRLQELSSPG